MFKILVSDKLPSEGLEILKREPQFQVDVKTGLKPEELKAIIGEYDAVVIRSGTKLTAEVLAAAKKLKAVARAGVGVDNVDVEAASAHGVVVMNTPGGNTISTAEHTLALLLALARNVPQAQASLKGGAWDRKSFVGTELLGKTLGVVGLGRVGFEVAKRARAFEMRVLGYDPYLHRDDAAKFGIEICPELDELVRQSDYITVHTPLNDATRGLIGVRELGMAKPGVRVINCARGGIVDEKALAAAIRSGKVAGAAVDVYEEEPPADRSLIDLPQVVCTPHLGASTEEAQVTVAVAAAEQLVDALLRNEVRFAVNLPSVAGSEMESLKPYLTLAERMGSIAAALLAGRPRNVRLAYSGEVAGLAVELISASFAVGLTRMMVEETVNLVSAPAVLSRHGVRLDEVKTSVGQGRETLLEATVTADGSTVSVTGTVFGGNTPRIVAINGYPLEAIPYGPLLILNNQDRPGLIGDIGSVLGEAGINIARMNFGRKSRHGDAITVLNLDAGPTTDVLEKIGRIEAIRSVRSVMLPPVPAS